MKYVICGFLLILFVISAGVRVRGQENKEIIHWYSFEEAYNLNKKHPKKVFVDVYTDWCGWCKKMDRETFQDPKIAHYMQKNFYCAKLNAERKDTVEIDGEKFTNSNPKGRGGTNKLAVTLLRGKMSYPSYVFLNEQNQTITMVQGFLTVQQFDPMIRFIGDDAFKNQKWEDYQSGFKK